MNYPVTIPGMEGQNIEVSYSFWTGNRLLVEGERAQKGTTRNQFLLKKNDGTTAVATWKIQALGFDVPQLQVDDMVVKAVEPLAWYELLWSILPVGLILIGGFIGAICGFVAFFFNGRIFRSDMSVILKYVVTALISGAAVVTWLIVAVAVQGLIQQ
jgi:hypothetical protein